MGRSLDKNVVIRIFSWESDKLSLSDRTLNYLIKGG